MKRRDEYYRILAGAPPPKEKPDGALTSLDKFKAMQERQAARKKSKAR